MDTVADGLRDGELGATENVDLFAGYFLLRVVPEQNATNLEDIKIKKRQGNEMLWLVLLSTFFIGALAGCCAGKPTPATKANDTGDKSTVVSMPKVEAKIGAVALSALIDEQLGSVSQALTRLASLSEVRSLDWKKMKSLLADEQRRAIPCLLWFARPDGYYFTVDKDFVPQNLKDRSYFAVVMSGKPVFGEVVVSKSTGKPSGVIAVPVMNEGRVVGILGATIYLDQMSERIEKILNLPPGVFYYALDPKGVVALHSRRELLMVSALDKGNPALSRAISEIIERREGVASYEFEGKRRTVAFCTSPVTGWRFALGVLP